MLTLSVGALASAQPAGDPVASSHQASPAWVSDAPLTAPVRLAQSTEAIGSPAIGPDPLVLPTAGPRQRGLLQSLDLSADWAPRLEGDSLGRSTFSASVGLGVPPLAFGMPLLIKPRAALHLLDGPDGQGAPGQLNEFDIGFGTRKQLGPRWTAQGTVTVGVYGDEDSLGESDALRVSGFGVAIYEASPATQWVFGAVYLNRDDIAVVPAVGVIHDRGDVRYELTAPRARVVWRLPQNAAGEEQSLYLAGELGGGAWAVRRPGGSTDTLNLSRWGLLFGYEVASSPAVGPFGGAKTRYEFGYLFGRNLEFSNAATEFTLDDSLLARVSWSY